MLSHFTPMFHYYTPGKCQKTRGFLTFSGGKEMKHWHKIGQWFDKLLWLVYGPKSIDSPYGTKLDVKYG